MGKIKGHAGVAFFGTSSLKADLKAFEWAYKHLPLSDEYKLRIIHVNELNKANPPRERPDSRYNFEDVPTKFKENYPDGPKIIGELPKNLKAHNVHKYICGVAYEGENFEAALQYAIEKEREKDGLSILVLAWWEEDGGRKGPPITINRLESEGCSVVFAKVDDSRKLTLSMPSTQTMSAPMASMEDPAATAAPRSPMEAADQRSNDGTHSESSNANTQRPDERATAASTETPKRASKNSKRSSKKRTPSSSRKNKTK